MGLMEEALEQTRGGGEWAKFENVGDTVSGEIVSMSLRQASDFTTKLPAVSQSGKPKMQLVIGIRIAGNITEDDDLVRLVDVNLWGIQREALDAAVQAFGRPADVGDRMKVTYIGKKKPQYTSSLAHAYEYAFAKGASVMPAPEPVNRAFPEPVYIANPRDDTPF